MNKACREAHDESLIQPSGDGFVFAKQIEKEGGNCWYALGFYAATESRQKEIDALVEALNRIKTNIGDREYCTAVVNSTLAKYQEEKPNA